MLQQSTRILCACLSLITIAVLAIGQTNLTAKANKLQPKSADGSSGDTDRVRDGLIGPVRRIRTEVVKLSNVAGKSVEDAKRVLLETAEYDVKGVKTQNQYFPISGSTLTGREVYKYDDRGNISEMTLVNADGSLLSKEVYKYEFDNIGNWVKMTTSVAVVENGKIDFEPTEATYRTIFYYLDAASMAKMLQPATSPSPSSSSSSPAPNGNSKVTSSATDNRVVGSMPKQSSAAKLNNTQVQQINLDMGQLSDSKKNVVLTDEPPAPKPLLKPMSGGVLNGKALALPAPAYPEMARRMRTGGKVEVEVIVDENGKVISARAISGPAMLRDVAVEAALRARFTPTKLSGQPVKISGRIDYNFTLP